MDGSQVELPVQMASETAALLQIIADPDKASKAAKHILAAIKLQEKAVEANEKSIADLNAATAKASAAAAQLESNITIEKATAKRNVEDRARMDADHESRTADLARRERTVADGLVELADRHSKIEAEDARLKDAISRFQAARLELDDREAAIAEREARAKQAAALMA